MTLRIILMIVCCWTFSFLSAQKRDKPIIVSTVDRGDYFFIPTTALADRVEGILYQLKIGKKVDPEKRPIQFYWISTCNDGYYNLTITPEQIFFSSSHDNPNPNYLFWVVDIDSAQYQQIENGVQRNPPQGFENLSKNYRQSLTVFYDNKFKDTFSIPDEWTDSIMASHDVYCQAQIERQLKRYFSIINSYIADTAKQLAIPFDNMKPKFFSFFRNEIYDWMPVKFDPPIKFTPPKTKDE